LYYDDHVDYADYNAYMQYSDQNEDVYDYPIEPRPSTIAAQLAQQLASICDPEIDYCSEIFSDDYDDY
jgi:hypothetical protein